MIFIKWHLKSLRNLNDFLSIFTTAVWSIVFFSSAFFAGAGLCGVNPAANAKVQKPKLKVEALIVEVNGERRRVDPALGFTVVRGDLVAVVEAWSHDKTKKISKVKVEGLRQNSEKISNDDRGRIFDSAIDLDFKNKSKLNDEKFAVRLFESNALVGEVSLQVVNPKLLSFEVEVNGQRRKLAEGERLVLGPKDGIKVIEVSTNVRGNENIKHELFSTQNPNGSDRKELRFTRGQTVFARIPIDWQGI